ncbi:hypothetical protein FMUND_1463 [Fusarium mundagurra]|uniref:MYND-type domain-containing protein n=1 Tax=Fusarium mundagurra TaxID=1567541 RepID=A0A8H6DP29_9HYPO|nr:hypothetical protein FMUND_1463 [Fusarium mundagurra]
MATPSLPCAHCSPDGTSCQNTGKSSCANCSLVVYCGSECQKAHWLIHKLDCKSSLNKASWKPEWAIQGRTPAFMDPEAGELFGGRKYLLGNVPALDVLRLDANEGESYEGHLRLLFAASGDLRNVIKTIAQIPPTYDQPIDIVINDRDIDIAARNVILLLIALTVDDQDEAVDCMIHVWYSAFIRKSHVDILKQRIRPFIQSACDKIKNKSGMTVFRRTWTFRKRTLRLILEKTAWDKLLCFTDVPGDLTIDKAREIRQAVTVARSRIDYRDRTFLFQSPPHRVAKQRYYQDGLLLRFGAQRSEYCEPNPTFFQFGNTWPMQDSADPVEGWSLGEVEKTRIGLAASDVYGKLFYYIRSMIEMFLDRVCKSTVGFQLLQVDAVELGDELEGPFDRIEVSNISDGGYLGIRSTVAMMAPLLRKPSINPHATLVTLFMNMVDENWTIMDEFADCSPTSLANRRLVHCLPVVHPLMDPADPAMVKVTYGASHLREYDNIFQRVVNHLELKSFPDWSGAMMKEKHTIIEKWPYRLKLGPGQAGGKEEFDLLMEGGSSGKELYLEWKRIQE